MSNNTPISVRRVGAKGTSAPVWIINSSGVPVSLPQNFAELAIRRDNTRTTRYAENHEIPDVPEVKQYKEDPINLTEKGRVRLAHNQKQQQLKEEKKVQALSYQDMKKKAAELDINVPVGTKKVELEKLLEDHI